MELSKPVIGAIEGAAVAGGMDLALWCDIRVMAETAYLGVYCRRWGITLMDGGVVRLPRLVGQGRALEIALTGRRVEAAECERIGLAERVVPHGEARAAAEMLAAEIARFPQEAVRAERHTIIETRGMSVRDAMKVEWAIRPFVGKAHQAPAGFAMARGVTAISLGYDVRLTDAVLRTTDQVYRSDMR